MSAAGPKGADKCKWIIHSKLSGQARVCRRVVDAAAKRKKLAAPKREERVTSKGLENGKSRDGDEHDRCVVCLERKCDAAFVPCGHMCCCLTCALKLLGKPCPLCRKRGIRILKIYRN